MTTPLVIITTWQNVNYSYEINYDGNEGAVEEGDSDGDGNFIDDEGGDGGFNDIVKRI